ARSLLNTLGIDGQFDVILGSDEVARPKPAPDIVLKAMEVMDSDPDRTVMVGDAVTDLASARGAGITAVAAMWGETDEKTLLAAEPDVILHKPSELLSLTVP
ncbi:HAD-IA family hydrolase, partial [Streptomyces albiflaviniger]|nr:HAD-IA family hydrolase [Streptomyces albiflaviniger]